MRELHVVLRAGVLILLVFLASIRPCDAGQIKETSLRFPSGIGSLQLSMRHEPPSASASASASGSARAVPVLILHGATFPSGNAAAWRMDGHSWMDDLAAAGYEVFALDFLGYGDSDRYPGMSADEPAGPVPDNVETLTEQVDRAVQKITQLTGKTQINLIAHSAGTFVAGRYAQLHPEHVARLVLFGAPAPSAPSPHSTKVIAPYFLMSAADELEAFETRVREAGRLDMTMFQKWQAAYLATDSASQHRTPPSVLVPSGMRAAAAELARSDQLPYSPEHITLPVLVIVGEWDEVAPPSQALWLFEHLAAPLKRLVILSRGGHRLHLERSRFQLYREIDGFLLGGDES